MRRSRLLIVGLVLLTACGNGASTDTTNPTTTSTTPATTTSAEPTTTAPPTTVTTTATSTTVQNTDDLAEGSGCTPGEGPLPDGEWFGFVTSRAEESLDFDLACWFTGNAATQAAAEDGEESPPPNDYYVRNANPDTREVPVGELVEVTFYPDGDPNNSSEIDYDDWGGMVATRGFELGVWLEIENGAIDEIHEQWVP
ncbi:MAG TPA: hypothetical protein VFL72_03805 [Acidimicrobiia bacterium]|nr:hypothetical protein [Acidimicrobiia bacterium]